MKRFKGIIIALSIIAALSGCGEDNGKDSGNTTGKTTGHTSGHEDIADWLDITSEENAGFYVMRVDDDLIEVSNECIPVYDYLDTYPKIEDGEFAYITADVDIYDGGEEGFMGNKFIKTFKSYSPISYDDAAVILHLSEAGTEEFTYGKHLFQYRIDKDIYMVVLNRGKIIVYKNGERAKEYEYSKNQDEILTPFWEYIESEKSEADSDAEASLRERGLIIPAVLELQKSRWENLFISKCNLNIYSSDEEFIKFVTALDENATFNEESNQMAAYYEGYISDTMENGDEAGYSIYRTCLLTEDISDGYVVIEDDPGYTIEFYYDPTGKYVLTDNGINLHGEKFIEFIEPSMTEVMIDTESITDRETIDSLRHAFHTLKIKKTIEDPEAVKAERNSYNIAFTDEYGFISEYTLVDNEYIIIDGTVYRVENTDFFTAIDNAVN